MAPTTTMDFFAHQDAARKRTRMLVVYYFLAVILIILAIYAAFTVAFIGVELKRNPDGAAPPLWDPVIFLWVTGVTTAIVVIGTLYKTTQLASGGGEAVARMLGGRALSPSTRDLDERKILNVVEEMAIASGTPVPRVFMLDGETSINAFAAGFTSEDAVIGVTRGCVKQLNREELQGVIAHEFSHIFNGDMRLNIRLMGVLNGILVISMVGYMLFRSALRGGGRSSKGKGGAMAILAFGLLVWIIGAVGILFAKLIKSAVSRQREFLSDASAVQFTRNPSGIANALRKIGGFHAGSRIASENAEQASHFYFANGLSQGLASLMATHPPLEERIRRIDPTFDGDFGRAAPNRTEEPQEVTSGFAPTPSRIAVNADQLISTIGTVGPAHIEYAARTIRQLPVGLAEMARTTPGATAIIYGLLLSPRTEVRERQIHQLTSNIPAETGRMIPNILRGLPELKPEHRLPLAEVALSSLRAFSADEYSRFNANVKTLTDADREVDLFEYTLRRMILRRLAPRFGKVRLDTVQYYDLEPLRPAVTKLLSCIAYWGTNDDTEARTAFSAACARLGTNRTHTIADVHACGLKALDDALNELVTASPPIKKRVVDACIACVATDGYVTVEESELLRAIADALDCPIPPLLAGQSPSAS